ncbi:MAG: hypothetical protein IKH91_05775 [Prevotella sp.]|nr:hypothetical protein [Prevotella sp.]
MKNLLLVFLLGFVLHLTASCTENNYMPEIETFYFEKEDTAEITDSLGDDSIADSKELVLNPNGPEISLYAHNSKSNQSAAIYGDYVFLISQGRGLIHIYNIRNKSLVNTIKLPVSDENSYYGNDLYHSNQATFGTEFYAFDDPFPLLYISQRARSDLRCFVEVFRIIPEYNEKGDAYKSIDAFLVQTIYFPPMTKENSLGNVNCAIDREKNLIYTYSRNNNKTDDNYGICKISCFNIPDKGYDIVYLEDSDILYSYMLNCSAVNMQGGCIHDGILYIGQGYKNAGYIFLNVVDLNKNELLGRIDLMKQGVEWEPEGCFYYNNHLMIAADNNIWEFSNIFEEAPKQ